MKNTEPRGPIDAPMELVSIKGQSGDAGLCVDGICAVPNPAPPAPDGAPAAGTPEKAAAERKAQR